MLLPLKGILLKPNMNHLETWPNLYKENKFVIFHNWDLSDLIDKITNIGAE